MLIVDLPGKMGVLEGLGLAKLGYRPLPLYNGDDEAAWGPRVATLTDAELTTALLIARQHKNAEIAGELHLSLGTINNRVSRIYQKLGLAESSRRERASTMTRLQPVLIAEQRRRGE